VNREQASRKQDRHGPTLAKQNSRILKFKKKKSTCPAID
jgi:formate hydrogenlyase subunit 4